MITNFDEKNAKARDLWDLCRKEYISKNPITKILFKRYFKRLEEFLKLIKKGEKVLEIGCGAGESSLRIHKFVSPDVHFEASDFETCYVSMIQEKRMPFKVSRESAYQLQREDRSFDCLIMLSVLEHLENPEAALKEIFRVSRKYVILSVPDEPLWRILNLMRLYYLNDWGNTPGHINHWSKKGIGQLASKFGRVIEIKRSLPWILILAEVN